VKKLAQEPNFWKELKEFIAYLRDKYPAKVHKITTDDLLFMQKVGDDRITNETIYYFELINSPMPLNRECNSIFQQILFWLQKGWDAEGIASWITGYLDVSPKFEQEVKKEVLAFMKKIFDAYSLLLTNN